MKKIISIVLTLTLVLGLCAVATLNAGAAQADIAQTSTPMFRYSDEPYQEVTPINGSVYGILGDADLDSEVSVMDATAIQLDCASLAPMDEEALFLADVDDDGEVSVMDATELQLFLADMPANEYITHTLYDDDLICYTFDQMADYFTEYGTYDSDDNYYYVDYDLSEYGYYLLMAYYPEYESIDFFSTFYEAESDATVSTLMMVERDNPVFEYSCDMHTTDMDYFEAYGTAELVDLYDIPFDISNDSFVSEVMSDFSECESVLQSQFILAISAADEMLWDYIDGNVYDIFW